MKNPGMKCHAAMLPSNLVHSDFLGLKKVRRKIFQKLNIYITRVLNVVAELQSRFGV